MKKICLIIPVFNALEEVKKCISSIIKNYNFELGDTLIADDCSNEKTQKYLKKIADKHPDKIKLHINKKNIGYLKNCNNAVQLVDADIIVLLNSDCEIPKGFTEKILNCFESDKNIITASPIASNSANYYIPQILPIDTMNIILEKTEPQYPSVMNSEGYCFCIRKNYIDKNGLFNPVYKNGYCEEVDFCFEVQEKGFKCVLIDNLYVKHKRNKSFGRKKLKLISQNNKILYSKWSKYIHHNEIYSNKDLFKNIINKKFGKFSSIFIFAIKLQKFLTQDNRIKSIKNLKPYKKRKSYSKVIYTCIVGYYDILPIIQTYHSEDWQYVCYTDIKSLINLKRIGMWEIRPLEFSKLDSTKNARWHKLHPDILFPEYEESIWIDANINIQTYYIFDLIKKENKPLLIPIHYCRNDIFDEITAVKSMNKESIQNLKKIKEYLLNEKMPLGYGLNETNLIYRKHHNPKVKKIMNEWWQMIENFTKRDQLSLSYVLWKNKIQISDIGINNIRIDPENYKIFSHNTSNTITGKILKTIFY